jgi:hypothetical protein
MNGTHQLLVYADDVALLVASKDVGEEVNAEKTRYKVVSDHQNAGPYHNFLLLINPLKMWQSSNVWEQWQLIRIVFTNKLRTEYIQGIGVTNMFRIFCLSIPSLTT